MLDEPTNQAKGGRARAEKLSPQQRSDIAQRGALARWGKRLPVVEYPGTLTIGGSVLPCAVLNDETRIISQGGFLIAIGRSRTPKAGTGVLKVGVDETPTFLAAVNLKPLLTPDLLASTAPVEFIDQNGQAAFGYKAEALTKVSIFFADALDAGMLKSNQVHIGIACRILVKALASVGIIALVDEATGYQRVRSRDALHRILEAYITKELLPWAKLFPDSFYEELFRLRGWQYDPESVKRPILVGKLTELIVYKKLPPGVLDELKRKNPKNERGRRRHTHHQFLTEDIGNPHLKNHLIAVTTLMRASGTWSQFRRLLDRAIPNPGGAQGQLFDKHGDGLDDDDLDE